MTKTNFAGLEVVPPGGSLSQDGYAFQSENPLLTDFLLKIGAILHRHDAHIAMANPTAAPVLTASLGGAGTIASSTTIYVGYTLEDPDGGESLPTPTATIVTPAGYADPSSAPTGVLSFAAGTLLANTLLYAVTVTDGNGGETALGPALSMTVTPAAMAEIQFSGLSAITDTSSGSSATAGWRMWRSIDGGSTWDLMTTGAYTVDTWIDNGSVAGDASVAPPPVGTTGNSYSLTVTVPTGQPANATFFNIYACTDGSFLSPCLLSTLPIGDLGLAQTYTSLTGQAGSPPSVSSCLPGANQLDPDTDLLDWHWKRPVSDFTALPTSGNNDGDVRVTSDTLDIYIWSATTSSWGRWAPGETTVPASSQTASYTLAATDAGTIVEMNLTAAGTLTIPANATVALPLNGVLEVCQTGAGQVTIAGATGVTVDVPPGLIAATAGQWASVGLRQRNPNEWLLSGNLAT